MLCIAVAVGVSDTVCYQKREGIERDLLNCATSYGISCRGRGGREDLGVNAGLAVYLWLSLACGVLLP